MISLNKEYNQIVNLIKFNVNFNKIVHNHFYKNLGDSLSQSPDYIIEKYNHWIGFEPIVDNKMYTPDNMTDFFNKYWKIWRPDTKSINFKLKNILMYLHSTQDMMNLLNMVQKFEEYIGPVRMISDLPDKKGLHHKLDMYVHVVLENNKDNLKVVLRDMKIESIIYLTK